MAENMEEENKVKIEETCVNLGYVKKELDEVEPEFEEKQYKIALKFENIFGEDSIEQRKNKDSLIGFTDSDVIMETGCIKLENVKEEKNDPVQKTIEQSHFEIIQSRCCKAWLEKHEHLEGHKLNCLENCNRLCHNIPNSKRKLAYEIDDTQGHGEISTPIDENRNNFTHTEVIVSKYSNGTGKANKKGTVSEMKRIRHTSEKQYKCSYCSYQTNRKDNLNTHINTHNDIKPFECDICKKKFGRKDNLKGHIIGVHSNSSEKQYKCSYCSYRTKRKGNLKAHINTHNDIKRFECDICKKKFRLKCHLKWHIIAMHSNSSEKEYKCSYCSYQTNRKGNLKLHIITHNDIKPFECDICKKSFTQKTSLKRHITAIHSNPSEKEYQCSKCSFQTNFKNYLKLHLNTHNDIKPFECDTCKKRFARKSSLKQHTIDIHSNRSEKEYKCTRCPYQTNLKGNLKAHLNAHNDNKPFECDICKKSFSRKELLKKHNNRHTIIVA